jgi:hypothetical protein
MALLPAPICTGKQGYEAWLWLCLGLGTKGKFCTLHPRKSLITRCRRARAAKLVDGGIRRMERVAQGQLRQVDTRHVCGVWHPLKDASSGGEGAGVRRVRRTLRRLPPGVLADAFGVPPTLARASCAYATLLVRLVIEWHGSVGRVWELKLDNSDALDAQRTPVGDVLFGNMGMGGARRRMMIGMLCLDYGKTFTPEIVHKLRARNNCS